MLNLLFLAKAETFFICRTKLFSGLVLPEDFYFLRCCFFSFQSNFAGALNNYESALSASAQREVRLLCLHEVGWSYVLLLRWPDAAKAFLQLKKESRWSQSFYCYLSSSKVKFSESFFKADYLLISLLGSQRRFERLPRAGAGNSSPRAAKQPQSAGAVFEPAIGQGVDR